MNLIQSCLTQLLRIERRPPSQQLVEHYAQREDVAAMVDARTLRSDLLGAHVQVGADELTALRQGRGVLDARQPEVPQLRPTLGREQDVLRLDVAVDDAGLVRDLDRNTRLTQTGAILGTAVYMAPEQVQGKTDLGPPCDVFALGAILYEALVGQSVAQVLDHLREAPPRVEHEDAGALALVRKGQVAGARVPRVHRRHGSDLQVGSRR